MIIGIVLVLICISISRIIFHDNKKETFDKIKNEYDGMIISNEDKNQAQEQRYLDFLNDLNNSFKEKMPITGAFRGTCDDKLNEKLQKEILKEAYTKLKERKTDLEFKKDPCVAYANHICELTDPKLYTVESNFAPRWLMKSFKGVPLPKYTDLRCFNDNYNCCKTSTKI